MHALVTGAAGFIGSSLAEALVTRGWRVRGIDRFTSYYEEAQKRSNLAALVDTDQFELVESDLLSADLGPVTEGIDVVFHFAAQPGVRLSWADGFRLYNESNVDVTQRLLEAVRPIGTRFVYASSSSVYGRAPRWPTDESAETVPHSPYGVTKLAGELLCRAYAANFGVPTVSLRLFTVYGPRQRPDMAIHRMIESARAGTPFPLFGDGSAIRDFTYVGDVVDAAVLAGSVGVEAGSVFNVAGGGSTSVAELIDLVSEQVGSPVNVERRAEQAGDVERTGASIERVREALGWTPKIDLRTGVANQVEWHRSARRH